LGEVGWARRSFDDRIDEYRRVHQGVATYGTGSRADQATRFYLDHLLGIVTERARQVSDRPRSPVDLLISLCGYTPTPTILTHALVQPRRMVLIVSKDAQDSIDVIHNQIAQPAGPLRPRDIAHHPCDPTDPLDIYRIIKAELGQFDSGPGRRPYAIIDITGGRKVMSAAAAMAAWQLKLDLSYMEGDYDPDSRHTRPGTDRMLILSDPNMLFGEQEMARALEMFRAGAFESAHRRYDEMCDSIEVPGHARFMRALSELYRAWCDLDLSALSTAAGTMRPLLDQARRELSAAHLAILKDQLNFVRRLGAGDHDAKLLWFYVLGQHYQRLGRHDFAALLFYRTIEGSLTERLKQRYPRLSPDRFEWASLDDPHGARQRYAALNRGLGGQGAAAPSRLTLMNSALVLAAENDELTLRCGLTDVHSLSRLRDLTRMRNTSVLAHGFQTVTGEQAKALHQQALDLLTAYWSLHGDGDDLETLCVRLQFLRTDR
jgi:hypothetical protein